MSYRAYRHVQDDYYDIHSYNLMRSTMEVFFRLRLFRTWMDEKYIYDMWQRVALMKRTVNK